MTVPPRPTRGNGAAWAIVLAMIALTAVALYASGALDLVEALPWKG